MSPNYNDGENTVQPKSAELVQTDCIEHPSADGRRYVIVIARTGVIHLFLLLFV